MKLHTVAALAVAVVAGGVGLSADVWAGGSGGGDRPCFIDTASSLGPSITGTVAIHGTTAAPTDLNVVLRLQSSGKEQIFRADAPGISVISPEQMACAVLAANPRNAAGETIQQAFVLGTATLNINRRSISGVDWVNPVPGTVNSMTIVEVTIYPMPHN